MSARAKWRLIATTAALAALCAPAAAALGGPGSSTPMAYLSGFGPRAYPVVSLTWAVLILSIAVTVIIIALVVSGCIVRHERQAPEAATSQQQPGSTPAQGSLGRAGGGLAWIYIGLALTVVPLLATMVWTIIALAAVGPLRRDPAVTIEVTGHQWWWEARYPDDQPSRVFTTANELHIPVGKPIEVRLKSADVIHSFWAPALAGKMQAIPGRTNVMWLQADRPGRYRGQCTQFCGQQHAQMAFTVVAQPQAAFDHWRAQQIEPAPQPPDKLAGFEHSFVTRCGACHSVEGTEAGGRVAPNLSHLMLRQTLAAGALPNTPGNLSAWIADPQSIKPGTLMPTLYLSGPELSGIATYLETLN